MSPLRKTVQVKLPRSGAIVAKRAVVADDSLGRLVGLLNHSRLEEGEGLLLAPCNQIHMFFMRFAIDAVFLAADDTVVAWGEYRPWRMSRMYFKARKVLEVPHGTCRRLGVAVGDRLEFEACSV